MRPPKREQTWEAMGQLQEMGLGRREVVSDDRDKFMVNPAHPRVTLLTTQPDADGFIRSDGRSLLLRNPSATVKMGVPNNLTAKVKKSSKGWEFSWGTLEEFEIEKLFAVVRNAAGPADT